MFETHREEITWGGRKLVLETGKVARQAHGAVLATYGDTTVLATVVSNYEPKAGIDFFPLTVNYQEKYFAAGRMRRPADRARDADLPPHRPPDPPPLRRGLQERDAGHHHHALP